MQLPPRSNQERLPELDGSRAISVSLVVQQHLVAHQFGAFLSRHPYLSHVEKYAGVLGVKVFFVNSGFVICRLLLMEERAQGIVSRPFQTVGVMSYGVYLWQQFVTVGNSGFLFGQRVLGGHLAIVLFPLLFVIVPASYYFVEKPAMRYGRKLSERAKKELAESRAVREQLSYS